jgi:hypothetical protein
MAPIGTGGTGELAELAELAELTELVRIASGDRATVAVDYDLNYDYYLDHD